MYRYLKYVFGFVWALGATAAFAQGDMVGSWHGGHTGGIELIVIRYENQAYTLQTYGRCPLGCNSEKVPANIYVAGNYPSLFTGATVTNEQGIARNLSLEWYNIRDYPQPVVGAFFRYETDPQKFSIGAFQRSKNNFEYGLDTCLKGYVWREASALDKVCVQPTQREQAQRDNNQASRRKNSPGSCLRGFYPRQAFDGDKVCVTAATRDQVRRDNQAADVRRLKPDLSWP